VCVRRRTHCYFQDNVSSVFLSLSWPLFFIQSSLLQSLSHTQTLVACVILMHTHTSVSEG